MIDKRNKFHPISVNEYSPTFGGTSWYTFLKPTHHVSQVLSKFELAFCARLIHKRFFNLAVTKDILLLKFHKIRPLYFPPHPLAAYQQSKLRRYSRRYNYFFCHFFNFKILIISNSIHFSMWLQKSAYLRTKIQLVIYPCTPNSKTNSLRNNYIEWIRKHLN